VAPRGGAHAGAGGALLGLRGLALVVQRQARLGLHGLPSAAVPGRNAAYQRHAGGGGVKTRTIEVVKVQQALYPPGGDAMIYDQGRIHVQQRPLTAAERHMMGEEIQAFFHAVWNATSTRWTLLERVAEKKW
jgi:hypothetical protein